MSTPREEALEIVRRVATKHGVGFRDIMEGNRQRHIVRARWAAIRAVREARPNWSSVQVGRLFNLDHSSVLYALKQHE